MAKRSTALKPRYSQVLVRLAAGELVPDATLRALPGIRIDESRLRGESAAVRPAWFWVAEAAARLATAADSHPRADLVELLLHLNAEKASGFRMAEDDRVRRFLWSLGVAADLTAALSGTETPIDATEIPQGAERSRPYTGRDSPPLRGDQGNVVRE